MPVGRPAAANASSSSAAVHFATAAAVAARVASQPSTFRAPSRMVRHVGVDLDPSPVARPVEAEEWVTTIQRRVALRAKVPLAPERGDGGAQVHPDGLAPAGPQAPDLAGGQRAGRDRGRGRGSDLEVGGQDRVGAGERHPLERLGRTAGPGPQILERAEGVGRDRAASLPDGRGQVKRAGYHAGREARRIEPRFRDGAVDVTVTVLSPRIVRVALAGDEAGPSFVADRPWAPTPFEVSTASRCASRRPTSGSRSPPTRFASAFSIRAATGCSASRPTAACPPRSSTAPAGAGSAPASPSPASSTSTGWARAAATSTVSG